MPLRKEDRAVWVGDPATRPIGSSGKVRGLLRHGSLAKMDWGGSEEDVAVVDREVVTCRQAANKGIEPWATVGRETSERDARIAREGPRKPHNPPRII